ncbi:hypothetical protein [Parafannyhessea umbonata]|uniref:Uncharacterized protein n=1 Tax=Parafannyhessea umbonata TaxID=604330 RepID=A0A1H1L650_9ACTN|nr:hypothetical protein [Parafannyhessea umbonata]SDR69399.1 hypothetical protein SAMN04489857_0685 [Parafannyhessea umbonata]
MKETKTQVIAYTDPNGKEYTAEALAALTRDERQALAEIVVTDAISELDDSELVWFIASYEKENYSEFGNGFDVFDTEEFFDCMTGSKADKWCSLIDDIVAAAVNGRVTGSDYIHYDSCGNLYIEDLDDVTARACASRDDFAEEVCGSIDPDDLTLDLRYVDVPDDVNAALEELATAYSYATDTD